MELNFPKIPLAVPAWKMTDDEVVIPSKGRSFKLSETYDWEISRPAALGGDGRISFKHRKWGLTSFKYEYSSRDVADQAFMYAAEHSMDVALNREIRIRCDVCGERFCYTANDIRREQAKATAAAFSFAGVLLGSLAGNAGALVASTINLNTAASGIVSFARCPHCKSRSLSVISETDDDGFAVTARSESEPNEPASLPASSSAPTDVEQILKYKELLDAGILTEEEFAAKKKQLLGL